MKITKIHIITILLMSTFPLIQQGQIAGYLGKRNIIKYDFYSFYQLLEDNPFRTKHAMSYEYMINRKANLCFCTQIYFNSNSFDHNFEELGDFHSVNAEGDYRLKGFNFGIGYKHFLSDWRSPIGKYFKIDLYLASYKAVGKDIYSANNNINGKDINSLIFTNDSYIKPFYSISFGAQRVIYDKLILDFGIQFGMIHKLYYAIAGEDNISTSDGEYIRWKSGNDFLRETLCNINIGIGGLF